MAYSDQYKARIVAALGTYYASHDVEEGVAEIRKDEARQAKREARQATKRLTEHEEQCLVVQYLEARGLLYFSVPNGVVFGLPGQAKYRYASYLRAEGLTRGAPDLVIEPPRGSSAVTFIEMKALSGKLSPEQGALHAAWRERGIRVLVAYGHEDAIKQMEAIYAK